MVVIIIGADVAAGIAVHSDDSHRATDHADHDAGLGRRHFQLTKAAAIADNDRVGEGF
jgi:hypothetical protein